MIRFKIALVVLVLLLGLLLRLHNYNIYPQRGASADEYAFAFLGISLIKEKVPTAWSAFPVYKDHLTHLTIRNLYFPIVKPYFDHPPLYGLVVGGWSMVFDQATFEDVDLKTIRLVPIFFSSFSSILVFLLGFRLYDFKTGVWALLIYSTATIFVINGRVVFAENMLTTFMLGTLYLFHVFKKNLTFNKTIILGIICGLTFLTKVVGIVVFLTLLFLFITEKVKPKFVITLTALTSLFVISFILYGTYYNAELFWQVQAYQSDRPIGPETLLYILSTPIIVNKIYLDGWYFLGFTSFFVALLDYKKYKLLLAPFFVYLMLLILSLTQKGEMGWYMIPFFPLMALLSARILIDSLKQKSWFIFAVLLFVGLLQIKHIYEANFGLTPLQFRILIFLIFAPLVLLQLFKKEKAFRVLGSIWFYLLILGTAFLTYSYIHPA